MSNLVLFEKYHNDELTTSEKSDFEASLLENSDFKAEHDQYMEMQAFLGAKPKIDAGKEEIQKLRAQYEEEKLIKKPNYKKIMLLAAIALLLLSAALNFLYFKTSAQSPEAIYAANFQPAAISITTKGDNSTSKNNTEAINFFNQGEYQKAFPLFDTTGVSKEDLPPLLYAKAISGIETDNLALSREIFDDLISSYPVFSNDSNWYIALSYLKENRINEVRAYLDKIPSTSNRSPQRDALLDQLEKL